MDRAAADDLLGLVVIAGLRAGRAPRALPSGIDNFEAAPLREEMST
jgi:hypothetical protein